MIILFLTSFFITAFCRRYALARNVMDIPNHRSSHSTPTPRGGGMAFVVVFLAYLGVLAFKGDLPFWQAAVFFCAGGCVALLGFVDDHHAISASYRLLSHFLVCGVALISLGGLMPILPVGWHGAAAELFMAFFGVFYLVWMLNLFNFMDGIDGLAACEGVFVCLGGALIYGLQGHEVMMALPLAMAAVVGGFLCWNFPVARIFMGDGGSGFLGLMIGLFAIKAAHVAPAYFWSWLILCGVFIVDATVTLLQRGVSGRRMTEAHRDHAYQHAATQFKSHIKVTLGVLVMNVVWLLPLAILVGIGALNGLLGLILAYMPLVLLVMLFFKDVGAGTENG